MKMRVIGKFRFVVALLTVVLVACSTEKPADQAETSAGQLAQQVVDMHTSRMSLDWRGTYEGLLDCADCAGVHALLTLDEGESFVLSSRPLRRGVKTTTEQGQFRWQADGNSIALETVIGELGFLVGEGRLILRSMAGSSQALAAENTVLAQMPPGQPGERQAVIDMLIDHHWALVDATTASNQRIDTLFPEPEQAFSFTFAGSSLQVRGGCNGLRGAFAIVDEGTLEITAMMSSMMACAMPLMDADAALAGLIAAPLEIVLIRGARPTLALLAETGEVLLLNGELTHEARYGAPKTVFLEVAAQRVACDRADRADGLCLMVRERRFDEHGLMVGEPADWQVIAEDIAGYEHQPGIRNVLRIKQFQPAIEDGSDPAPILVLDLVVESELVTE